MNFNDVAIVSVKGSDNRIHFWFMSKDDAINIVKNFDLNERYCTLCIVLLTIAFIIIMGIGIAYIYFYGHAIKNCFNKLPYQ